MIAAPVVATSAVRVSPWLSWMMRPPIELPPVSRMCSSLRLGKRLWNAAAILSAASSGELSYQMMLPTLAASAASLFIASSIFGRGERQRKADSSVADGVEC